jgi:hypothetical protein
MRFSAKKTRRVVKHTISGLTDSDMCQLYHRFKDHKIGDEIKQHLIDCVDEDDLDGTGVDTAEEYVSNWLNDVKETKKSN